MQNLSHLFSLLSEVPLDIFSSRKDPLDPRMGDAIVRNQNLLACLESGQKIDIAILGIPQDIGVQRNGGRIGARLGPEAIRKALYKLTFWESPLIIADFGDVKTDQLCLEEIQNNQKQIVGFLLERKIMPIVLGGGHDIAYPDAMALGMHFKEFGVINLDAHADVRPLLPGNQSHSGSPFRQILESPHFSVPSSRLVEFGLQKFSVASDHANYILQKKMTIFWYDDIRKQGVAPSLDIALNQASNQKRLPVFVSLDVDSIRASDAPGVSAPSPLGFYAEEICDAMHVLGKCSLVKILDIAEMNPSYDMDGHTAKMVGLAILYFIAGYGERADNSLDVLKQKG